MKSTKQLLAAALLLPFLAGAAPAQAPSLDARVNLRVADQSVEDVVLFLRERSGANIVVIDLSPERKISDKRFSLDLSDVPWRDALQLVAEKVNGVVEERTGGVLVVTQPPTVQMFFDNADVREVINMICKQSGANVVVSKDVAGTVSVRFNDVPWRHALEVTVKTLGYAVVEEQYGILRVVSPESLQAQMESRAYQLRYLRPKSQYKPIIKSEFLASNQQQAAKGGQQDIAKTFSVLQALQKALSERGKIDYIETQNVVIVQDTIQVHEAIKNMIARLDVEPMQVFCDVKFVSTTNTDVLNLGVDFGDRGPSISAGGGQIPITVPFDMGAGGWDDWFIASGTGDGPFTFTDPANGNAGSTIVPSTIFGALSFTQFQATLRLLQRDSRTEVIQAPKIIALDGNEATIFVGETIRYAEAKSEQGQAGGLQLSVAEAGASPVEVGFQLLVRPYIVPGTQKIQMDVIPKETSLSGSSDGTIAPVGFEVFTIGASGLEGSIALPRTRSSTIVSSMMLESGQTAMIGGLTTEADVETQSAVPGLSKIPLLGELFKHESSNRDRRSLMVFITPSIVRSAEDQEQVLQAEFRRRRGELQDKVDQLLGTEREYEKQRRKDKDD